MNRRFGHRLFVPGLLVVSTLAAPQTGSRGSDSPCDQRVATKPLDPAAFHALLDTVASGWNRARPELAAGCFTEGAVYLEPPDRQVYRGRPAIRAFFAESTRQPQPDRMRWHAVAFDPVRQIGFGEYTYRGRQNYHGIVVVRLDDGLIHRWREYQYGSPLSWDDFVGSSR
jgi:hypothetical protein